MEASVVTLSEIDRAAMTRAIKLANERQRAHDVLRDGEMQIDRMLKARPWPEVGSFAAYSCQMQSLGLKPWQSPPCFGDVRGGAEDTHAAAAMLLKRLLDARLSRFEPDPIGALQAIEHGDLPPAA